MRAILIDSCRGVHGVAVAAAVLLAGCLGGSGGGSAGFISTIGGAPESACNAEYHTQGCYFGGGTQARVECKDQGDGTAKWTKIDDCPSGKICQEKEQAGAAQPGTMKQAECNDPPVTSQPDTTGGGGGGAQDGGPAKTPAQEFTCVESKCATEIAACMANTKCATLIACSKACQDEACVDACSANLTEADFVELLAVLGPLDDCGKAQDCISDCGNGKCQAGENAENCADDCGAKTVCGNGTCEEGETTANCAQDCKAGAVCGNGTCEEGESTASCPQDCKAGGSAVCGDGTCADGESATCPIDCDATWGPRISCAKEKCASTYSACAADEKCLALVNCFVACGADGGDSCVNACVSAAGGAAMQKAGAVQSCIAEVCSNTTKPVCGNEVCESGETKANCPADCGSSGPVCGNETCESGESYTSCPSDCPCTSDSQCGSGKTCVEGSCVTSGGSATCGDFVCSSGENCTMDCNAEAKAAAQCAQSKCSSQWNSCKGNSGCWAAFVCMNQCGESQSCIEGCASKAGSGLNTLISLGQCADQQCGDSGPVCGNGTCEAGETSSSCPTDCKAAGTCSSNIDCASGQTCVAGKCQSGGSNTCTETCTAEAPCTNGVCTKVTSGSCANACGGPSGDGCYCDELCQQPGYFDCCPDIKLVCTP
ncbi:MAG: hypothetical protein RIT45_2182 [Pseudomonadota bacterium]|jgi:hypothetical protein